MLSPGVLGVDIGSVAVSFALIDSSGEIHATGHRMHKGRVRETLRALIGECGPVSLRGIGLTSSSPRVLDGAQSFDPQYSLITGCRRWFPSVRSILWVGGERFGLIRLGEDGAYGGARGNSSCAAGTGSFLDQQARRLGLGDVEELARRALASTGRPPRISTRCAVFARTDLVHAQQTGCSLEEICDGLCRGLAQNIADTLFCGAPPTQPIVFAGGVALNGAVRRHLEELLGAPLSTHPHAAVFAAIGAALLAAGEPAGAPPRALDPGLVIDPGGAERSYFFKPLEPSAPQDASSRRLFRDGRFAAAHPVEVEIYATGGAGGWDVRMGVDVGSTSTKAILIGADRAPVAGFYTRTLGSPLEAVQALGEAIEDARERLGIPLRFLGAAATGAGRKLIGAIVKADLVVDEITAHARAAYEMDPDIDTIIEIGGQDAKFTTMRGGMVTFAHMNTVCAAGTGSFLEEQAERLGCGLEEYERRVRGARAPLASDRCAVFMERDINTFLSQGFSTEEILAAALYSVRENYLSKVARGAAIGERIAFQGATARNGALVAAFQEGLGRPILVSRYCHLAGALGAALLLAEKGDAATRFIGLDGLAGDIPIRSETCSLCGNHCRLRIATVAGETVAYGFLCGRDYDSPRRGDADRSGFDLPAERKRAFAEAMLLGMPPAEPGAVIGIPAALGLVGTLPLWKRFFSLLGVSTVTSESFTAGIDRGREVQGAEFCAPLAALHGHVRHLGDRADWLFLPVSLRESSPGRQEPRVHCYYTQYSSALASFAADEGLRERCLMPSADLTAGRETTKRELRDALARAGYARLGLGEVSRALDQAAAEYAQGINGLQAVFRARMAAGEPPCVVLLGRAYNVLSPEMSKGIPGIFSALGVTCFFQDMVPYDREAVRRIEPLLEKVHWLNAAKILEVACVAADTPGLYPVYMTSFKCTPDSFTLEYFKRILDENGKPYLILQLDDHDSTLGYETRIEAGVASFRNHVARSRRNFGRDTQPGAEGAASGKRAAAGAPAASARRLPVVPRTLTRLDGRTLLFPCWDPLTSPLLAANLRSLGVDVRLLREDPVTIRRAMRQNTGQCLPLSIIAQEAVDLVGAERLAPERTAVWLPTGGVSCNLGMFIPFTKTLLESFGPAAAGIQVLAGDMYFTHDFPLGTLAAYKAYLVGGLLRRAACRLRPYEREPGAIDRAVSRALDLLVPAFGEGRGVDAAIRNAAGLFDAVAVRPGRRPRVAVFGDLYVRDNDVMNQGLLRAIEDAGGEAVTTPYVDYIAIIAESVFRKIARAGHPKDALRYRMIWRSMDAFGRGCRRAFARILGPDPSFDGPGEDEFLRAFGLRDEHDGESFENLLKIRHLVRAHPDCALFVQASPAFCCPSLVTEAMARGIERLTGVPVVSITYDGTGRYRNDAIAPYLQSTAR